MFGRAWVQNNSEQTMDIRIIKDLLDRYIAGSASPAEQKIVEQWLDENELPENDWHKMNSEEKAAWMTDLHNELKKDIDTARSPQEEKRPIPFPWYRRLYVHLAAAAAIIIAAGTGWYFMFNVPEISRPVIAKKNVQKNDIRPGSNKAVLTLANGKNVVLDDSGNGVLTKQGNIEVSKKGAQLVYSENDEKGAEKMLAYNMLTTPRGGQYKLVLPDGSQVWLNAASSIRYPVEFADDIREVEIKGEAYFEVASQIRKGKKIPFNVHVASADGEKKSSIEVLGTHFNINAYDDEVSVNTTLLEGRVKVLLPGKNAADAAILSPGQQAQINTTHEIKVISEVNTEETIAWKNGLFLMNKAAIPVVLRQLARWYDVDIVYTHGIPAGRITGDIPRSMQLSEVLKVMELSGIKFRIEGKQIIVEP